MSTRAHPPSVVQILAVLATLTLGEIAVVAQVEIHRASLFGFQVSGAVGLLDAPAAARAITAAHAPLPAPQAPDHAVEIDPLPFGAPEAPDASPALEAPPAPAHTTPRSSRASATPAARLPSALAAVEQDLRRALATIGTAGTWTIGYHPLQDGTPRIALRFFPAIWSLGSLRQGVHAAVIALAPYAPALCDGHVWITLRSAEAAQAA